MRRVRTMRNLWQRLLLAGIFCVMAWPDTASASGSAQGPSLDLLPALAKLDIAKPTNESISAQNLCSPELGQNCRIVAKRWDRRQSFIMRPGTEAQISLEAGPGDEIRFALDRPRNLSNRLELTLILEHADGTLKKTFTTPPMSERWTEIAIPVQHEGAQSLTLRVETHPQPNKKDAVAIAAPRLVRLPVKDLQQPPNIVLYLMDTLRADHTSSHGYHRDTTPHLATLAAAGWNFKQASSTAPRTRSSTASILTSLYPSQNRAEMTRGLDLQVESLAEVLRRNGWSTSAYVANGNVFEPAYRFDQGFDRFVTIRGKNLDNHAHTDEIHEKILPMLDQLRSERFFLYVHAVDPHSPYDPPEGSRHRFTKRDYEGAIEPEKTVARILGQKTLSPEDFNHVVGLYDEDIRYQDESFGRLLDAMREKGLLDNTIIVVVSDHGDEFLEHGRWEHGDRLYEHQLHVPFVIHGPGIEPRTIETPTSLIDVMPTILARVGIAAPSQSEGRDAAPVADAAEAFPGSPVYAEETKATFRLQSLRQGPWKIIRTIGQTRSGDEKTPIDQLYHLDRDPREQTDLSSVETAKLSEMQGELDQIRDRLAQRTPAADADAPSIEIDERTRRQLRALGYLVD